MKKNIFNPLVSIIIPVYNGSNYIEEAITCALNQTYKNIEIVVINDGSTDNGETEKICLKYKDKIKYYLKENGGCASALNFGIRKSNGEFISWLSHDDLYSDNKIEYQISMYTIHNLDPKKTIISNPSILINKDGKKFFHPVKVGKGFYTPHKALKYLLFKRCFNGCGLLIPKNIIIDNNLFFNENYKYLLDWELWVRFTIYNYSFFLNRVTLVKNRIHNMQVTVTQKNLLQKEQIEIMNYFFNEKIVYENKKVLLELYYFARIHHFDCAKDYYRLIKIKKIRINHFKLWYLSLKNKISSLIKKIYHNIIRS